MLQLRETADGVEILVKVTPGTSRDAVLGERDGVLRVAVSAAPEKGKANKAACALIAKTLGVAKSRISVIRGETARNKKILVRDVPSDKIRHAFET
jgi:uncharacterized protein (TIGR00251 family)